MEKFGDDLQAEDSDEEESDGSGARTADGVVGLDEVFLRFW